MQGLLEHNREQVEIWLTCYAGPYSLNIINKESQRFRPNSRMPVSVKWLEAARDPEVQVSNIWMQEVVLKELREHSPLYFAIIRDVYLGSNPDYAAPSRWREHAPLDPVDAKLLQVYEFAMSWIVNRLGTRVLVVPDPEEAKDFIEEIRVRQRICKQVFWRTYRETGSKAKARKEAVKASGYSPQHVGRIIAPKKNVSENTVGPSGRARHLPDRKRSRGVSQNRA